MNHTRKGKIARLPDQIREQVNLRLHDNEPGETILQWLNSKPEVQAILKAQFGGCPINKQNLSDWRQGGFRDWQTRQDALQFVEELDDEQALGPDSLTAPLGPRLAHWVGLHYAASAKALIAHEMDPALKWARLNELCANVARLRRGELAAERLDIESQWLAFEQEDRDDKLKQDLRESELLLQTVRNFCAKTPPTPAPKPAPASRRKPQRANRRKTVRTSRRKPDAPHSTLATTPPETTAQSFPPSGRAEGSRVEAIAPSDGGDLPATAADPGGLAEP